MKMKQITLLIILFSGNAISGFSQQFNSDSYLTMPHGIGTMIFTAGERNSTLYMTAAVLPRFEVGVSANLYNPTDSLKQYRRFTSNLFVKYMFWVNESKTGGGGIFFGMGQSPGYYGGEGEFFVMHKNYWTAVPFTFPLFNNVVSLDIMPGGLVDFEYGADKKTAWGFSYSTRLAIYKVIPKTAIVGELYGAEGEAYSKPEFKVGLRWEPNDYIVPAFTYGACLDGSKGAGFEIGPTILNLMTLRKIMCLVIMNRKILS